MGLLFFSLSGSGCRFLRESRAVPSREGEGGNGSPRNFVALTKNATGFSTSGGIARTSDHILISDPDGVLFNATNLNNSAYEGAMAINPAEAVPIP